MAYVQELNKAVVAHGLWKIRLRMTIASGRTEFPLETIMDEGACELGQWLDSQALSTADRQTADYQIVKDLHAQCHKLAGQVAKLAVAGNKADAERLLTNEFETASVRLTGAMTDWKSRSR